MSARVAFRTADSGSAIPFVQLGQAQTGAWGLVEDPAWLAAQGGDDLELLYLSPSEYEHAVRGLSEKEVERAIEHHRTRFAANVPAQALGLVEQRALASLGLPLADAKALKVRADVLTAVASSTIVPRFAATPPLVLLDYLREGDAEILAELDSPSTRAAGDFDHDGSEREARRRFASACGQIAAHRGQPDKARVFPYFDVERTYFVTPPNSAVLARAKVVGDPTRDWRDGTILPLPERMAAGLEGHTSTILFPAPGPFVSALGALTPAQLEVELAERMVAPGFAAYLNARRLQQAALRAAVHLIAGSDRELAGALAEQTREEASRIGNWLAQGASETKPGAPPGDLQATVGTATLLAALCRRWGRPSIADKIEALAQALSPVAEEAGN